MIPGEYILADGDITGNAGRATATIVVVNTGDRPVQVGSHFHFFEVNKQLEFDREKTLGKRLDIPAGTAVRFEPGEEKQVRVVDYGGQQNVYGFNNLMNGNPGNEAVRQKAMEAVASLDFKNKTT